VIALTTETGERVWHFQTVRHDIWNRDLPAPPNLVTIFRSGQPRDAVAQITKSGYVYLFDREKAVPGTAGSDRSRGRFVELGRC
jgi:quinoprotein glucose dehydrogenase